MASWLQVLLNLLTGRGASEESRTVNPDRDEFFASKGGWQVYQQALANAVGAVEGNARVQAIFNAKTSAALQTAIDAAEKVLSVVTVGFRVVDAEGKGLAGAAVEIRTDDGATVHLTTDDQGAVRYVPVLIGVGAVVTVLVDGYQVVQERRLIPVTATDNADGWAPTVVLQAKSKDVDPSDIPLQALARIRGAMWTFPGPWRFGPRPGQPNNITAMEFIFCYEPQEQQAMIDAYKGAGYTHVCIGPINAQSYRQHWPDRDFRSPEAFEQWLDVLQLFWNNGLMPICFLGMDNVPLDQVQATYNPLIVGNARAQRLMRIVVPAGWEPTRYGWSSQTWAAYMQWAKDILPNALRLLHTVADVDAPVGTDARGDDNGKPNAEGWARVCPLIHGWLTQSAAFADPNKTGGDTRFPQRTNFQNWVAQFDITDEKSYANRFKRGYAGWPTSSAWGPGIPIKLYPGEYASYWVYHEGRSYEEGCTWGDAAIRAGADGYLDGGTVDVP